MSPHTLATEQETVAFGRQLASSLRPGAVVALVGGLGAGKTHLAKGLADGLGYTGEVTSPTFTLVHEYSAPAMRLPLFHFDFYRLERPDEVLALGWDEYLEAGGVCVVEWADLFPALLPPGTQWWKLSPGPAGGRLATPVHEISPPRTVESAPPETDPPA